MLIVSRKVGEVLRIGDNIEVMPVRCSGGGVRLGISAPREIAIVRQEIDGRPVWPVPPAEGLIAVDDDDDEDDGGPGDDPAYCDHGGESGT